MIRLRSIPDESSLFQQALDNAKDAVKSKVDYAAGKYPVSEDFQPVWSKFKGKFEVAQGGKCAFCETKFQASSFSRMDHFRPKSEVCEPTSKGNREDTNGSAPERKMGKRHRPGYWWLAYDWENYVVLCEKCNNWKSSSFPLEGGRSSTPLREGDEKKEKPLLINPYLEDPLEHLTWDETGRVKGQTDEGRTTVDRCGLDRESLRQAREEVARFILERIDEIETSRLKEEIVVEKLLELCQDDAPYAGMARALVAKKLQLPLEVWSRTAESET